MIFLKPVMDTVTKKLIFDECIDESAHRNTSKPNPRAHWRDFSPWSNGTHPRDTKMVQYTQIKECNTLYQQHKGQKPDDFSVDSEKPFDNM